jgi:FliI/YscN family ATPase
MIARLSRFVTSSLPRRSIGKVLGVKRGLLQVALPSVAIGDLCQVERRAVGPLAAQAVAIEGGVAWLAPADSLEGIRSGLLVVGTGAPPRIRVSPHLLGRVVDPFAKPLDEPPSPTSRAILREVVAPPPQPLHRPRITLPFETGVGAIDLFCPLAYGQRVGLFAGPGVGKSTLLGMIACHAAVDVTVVALVGERGREVREFVEEGLGTEGRSRAVVVVATSDEAPLRRMLAAETAAAIAEYFRDTGQRVLLVVDSLTRTARALREVGLGTGELPVRGGYPPSVYAALPRLLERGGTSPRGSITALYTLLTPSDTESDPFAEEVKSILDGHLVLDPGLAARGIFPALDPLKSLSRLADKLLTTEEEAVRTLLVTLADRLRRDRDIMLLGGTPDPELQAALQAERDFESLILQKRRSRYNRRELFARARLVARRFESDRMASTRDDPERRPLL